jgi:hypothetical protein
MTPRYQIRAEHDETTIVVYQAYRPEIAEAAVLAGRFVAPFSRERMTWVKPSFAWMMHRCAWATKPGQERVLALRLTRAGFDHALAHACLSSFLPQIHHTHEAWQERLKATPVRVQWDPERTLRDERLEHRSIQIGLGPAVVPAFVDTWIVALTDITPLVRTIRARLDAGDLAGAEALRPSELPYPVPAEIAAQLGMDSV